MTKNKVHAKINYPTMV